MAHQLADSFIRLHQALHGYADGHRLLFCSTALKPRDAKTMLIMSDASGPGAVIGQAGYLTGYPLQESGFYALAKTWAATEMSRPGCVWTHTLLLDFADLATLPGMDTLADAFHRPRDTSLKPGFYDTSLQFRVQMNATHLLSSSRETLARILFALYGHPKERVIASWEEYAPELVFSLWAQQWPRLRRTFRFCTLAFSDRSWEGGTFDLQLVPEGQRSIRSRFLNAIDADRLRLPQANWIEAALQDLLDGADDRLRQYLRQVGADVSNGREAFEPLCQLYQLLPDFPGSSPFFEEALDILDTTFENDSGNAVRKLIVSSAVMHPDVLSERAMTFAVQHINLLGPEEISRAAASLGRAIWSRNPEALLPLIDRKPPEGLVADEAFAKMTPDELIDGLRRCPEVVLRVVARRPDLFAQPALWAIPGAWLEEGLASAGRQSEIAGVALNALIATDNTDIIHSAVRIFGSGKVLNAVANRFKAALDDEYAGALDIWLSSALMDSQAVSELLGRTIALDRSLLLAIARKTYPDFIPNDFGEDPWWTAARDSVGHVDDHGRQYLAAYLLTRAFGYRSRNQAELIVFSFDDVYVPALESRLSSEAWAVIQPRLPRSRRDWDYCQRLRDAVMDAFVDRNLSPLTFTQFTRNDDVFEEITKAISRTYRGRRFLENAKLSLVSHQPWSPRIKVLDDFM